MTYSRPVWLFRSDAISVRVSTSASTMRRRIGSELIGAIDVLGGADGGHAGDAEERFDVVAQEFALPGFLQQVARGIVG